MLCLTQSVCLILGLSPPGVLAVAATPRSTPLNLVQLKNERRIRFDDGWRFFKGEAAGELGLPIRSDGCHPRAEVLFRQ